MNNPSQAPDEAGAVERQKLIANLERLAADEERTAQGRCRTSIFRTRARFLREAIAALSPPPVVEEAGLQKIGLPTDELSFLRLATTGKGTHANVRRSDLRAVVQWIDHHTAPPADEAGLRAAVKRAITVIGTVAQNVGGETAGFLSEAIVDLDNHLRAPTPTAGEEEVERSEWRERLETLSQQVADISAEHPDPQDADILKAAADALSAYGLDLAALPSTSRGLTDEQAPVEAWLIREIRGDVSKVLSGHVFKREEAARAAALRLTNGWRLCQAFPVVAAVRQALDQESSR